MERKLHLPEWVKDRFTRQKQDEQREAMRALDRMRAQAMENARHQPSNMPRPHSATKRYITRMERRRIGKRTRLARRGKPIHNFRIHT